MSGKCRYHIQDGIRYVIPHIHEYKTFAKGRWLGRELLDVLLNEFGGLPKDYWLHAIDNGLVRINNKVVTPNYVIQNSDAFVHKTHRFV